VQNYAKGSKYPIKYPLALIKQSSISNSFEEKNMKNNLLIAALFISLISLVACSEDKTNDITPSGSTGFVWTDNAGNTITADSAYYVSQYKSIKAFKGGIQKLVEINLTAGAAGTYTIGTNNAFSYLTGQDLYLAASGSVIITSNANSKMSGSFTTVGTGASITSITGTFIDIPVK